MQFWKVQGTPSRLPTSTFHLLVSRSWPLLVAIIGPILYNLIRNKCNKEKEKQRSEVKQTDMHVNRYTRQHPNKITSTSQQTSWDNSANRPFVPRTVVIIFRSVPWPVRIISDSEMQRVGEFTHPVLIPVSTLQDRPNLISWDWLCGCSEDKENAFWC